MDIVRKSRSRFMEVEGAKGLRDTARKTLPCQFCGKQLNGSWSKNYHVNKYHKKELDAKRY